MVKLGRRGPEKSDVSELLSKTGLGGEFDQIVVFCRSDLHRFDPRIRSKSAEDLFSFSKQPVNSISLFQRPAPSRDSAHDTTSPFYARSPHEKLSGSKNELRLRERNPGIEVRHHVISWVNHLAY